MGACSSSCTKQEDEDVTVRNSLSWRARDNTHTDVNLADAEFEDMHVLVAIPFFEDLDQKHLKALSTLFTRQSYSKGQMLSQEGKDANLFSVIVSGQVEILASNDQKDTELAPIPLCTKEKGEWFGEIALVGDSIQQVTVRALEPTTVLSISVDHFQDMVNKYPELSVSLISPGRFPAIKLQLKRIPFFADVPEVKLHQLGYLMEFKRVKAKEVICRQGDEADGFYYIADGRVHVSAIGADNTEIHLDTLVTGNWFGEIALIENVRRTATITSTQDCVLMYLSRARFETFCAIAPEVQQSGLFKRIITKRTANSLKAIPMFAIFRKKQVGPLEQYDEQKLTLLGEMFRYVNFKEGEHIYSEGDDGDSFFIIVSGTAKIEATSAEGKVVELAQLHVNDYFGENALLFKSKRNASVTAIAPMVALKLSQNNFQNFLQVAPEIENTLRSRVSVRTAMRLKDIPFFRGIKENRPWSKLDLLGGLFEFEEKKEGELVFAEGAKGDKFYIIVDGTCVVSVNRGKGPVILDRLKEGDWFGEIALMLDTPRTAEVKCSSGCIFLSITSDKFHKFLTVAPELTEHFDAMLKHRTANVLKTIDLFKNVKENKPWSKMEMLGTLLSYQQVEAGEVLHTFGDIASKFYIIVKGTVKVTGQDSAGNMVDMGELTEQGHFGEIALLQNRPQTTRVTAVTPCTFMVLTREAFFQFLKVAPELKPYFEELIDVRKKLLKLGSISLHFPDEKSSEAADLDDSSEASGAESTTTADMAVSSSQTSTNINPAGHDDTDMKHQD